MQDKRRHARWRLSGPVRIKQAGVTEEEDQARVKDISPGGICFLTKRGHLPESELELVIELPDEERFICSKGKAVWQKDEIDDSQQRHVKIGISFNMLRDADRERIFNYAFKFCGDEMIGRWWNGLEPRR